MAQLAREREVEVIWLPYELRPAPAPLPVVTPEELPAARARWEQGAGALAERFGVTMRFAQVKPRSRLAHEAAEFARDNGQFDALRVALLEAYHVEGQDIGDAAVLADLAERVGLPRAALEAALADGRYTPRVQALEDYAQQLGVTAVPAMIFGSSVAVEGAQMYPVLLRAYDLALQHETATDADTAAAPPGAPSA